VARVFLRPQPLAPVCPDLNVRSLTYFVLFIKSNPLHLVYNGCFVHTPSLTPRPLALGAPRKVTGGKYAYADWDRCEIYWEFAAA
jgi:hypothetical protein